MAGKREEKKSYGAKFRPVKLDAAFNWPPRSVRGEHAKWLAQHIGELPAGEQEPWGVPFQLGEAGGKRVIVVGKGRPEVSVPLSGTADFLCVLHEWPQAPEDVHRDDPQEGLVVAEYTLAYSDGSEAVLPVRGRFEVRMIDSPGPPWLAVSYNMYESIDPCAPPAAESWAWAQTGVRNPHGTPFLCAMPNPHPERPLRSLGLRGLQQSPFLVAGLTLCSSSAHPLRHLPRRAYRVATTGKALEIEDVDVDLGVVTHVEETAGTPGARWVKDAAAGTRSADKAAPKEKVIHAVGARDATVSVSLKGRKTPLKFSLGEAFETGSSADSRKRHKLHVVDGARQWMTVTVRDGSTGEPTPVRIHFRGPAGNYIAPYGHHEKINTGWFMDYGADVVVGGRNYAYVPGEFRTELPVGDVYVEINKGYEYAPVRRKLTVRPGQKTLDLTIDRAVDWRAEGWVTADTHVHFISPHTAWLEGQCEGVNVVNLLASQWGRLFTNVGDLTGKPGVVQDDTIVFVGTENRNHMLGHMSMLGTKGAEPVYPMCCGGPSESWIGDPDFRTLAEWAAENRRKGGVVIRPHYPYCGHTEDPVPILAGLVDALEIGALRGTDFPTQEWYRYLNCGYRVAVAGGTDKMGAYCPLGWLRTYALLEPGRRFTYPAWAKAVREGRTFSTNGPLIRMTADGRLPGDTIEMTASGGTVEVCAEAQSVWPLGRIEIVHNGQVVASESSRRNTNALSVSANVELLGSGWIAARCAGRDGHPAGYTAAHTSPVYVRCGDSRAFDGRAAEHMLSLVQGGIEYLNTLATVYDEASRKRMVKLFKEARAELEGRLVVEAGHHHHHGSGAYHTHGHGTAPGHTH